MSLFSSIDNAELDIEPATVLDDANDSICDSNAESVDEFDNDNDSEYKLNEPKTRKRRKSKKEVEKEKKGFQTLFNENRDLFDMSCDFCSNTFESFDEARKHYSSEHLNPKGYIKSKSGIKLFYRNQILMQIDRQTNPDKFK